MRQSKYINRLLLRINYTVILFLFAGGLVNAQTDIPTQYRDYGYIENLDSLQKAVEIQKNKPLNYLHGLILLEKNRHSRWKPQASEIDKIIVLAQNQHSDFALAMCWFLKGNQTTTTNLKEAIQYYTKANEYFEKNKDTTGIIFCYFNLINLNFSVTDKIGDSQSPKQLYSRILALGLDNKSHVVDQLSALYTIISFGSVIYEDKTPQRSINAFNKATALIKKYPVYQYFNQKIYTNMAYMYEGFKLYDKSLEFYLKTYQTAGNNLMITQIYNLASAYGNVGNYKLAEKYLGEAIITYSKNKENHLFLLQNIYSTLGELHFKQGKYQEAWKSRTVSDSLREEVNKQMQSDAFLELQTKYESNKKEQANQVLLQQQQRLYQYIGFGLLAFMLIAFFFFRLQVVNIRIKELMNYQNHFYTLLVHDLRSPINALHGIGDVVQFLVKNNRTAELATVTNRIEEVGIKTSLLLNNMIEWGKTNQFKLSTKPEYFDAIVLIKQLYEEQSPLALAKSISLTIQLPEVLMLNADPKGIVIVLRNMLDNAQKHTPKNGSITVSTEILDRYTAIHVSDTGGGINPEQLAHIKAIFAKKIKANLGQYNLGLGIILMQDFASQNKGIMQVSSQEGVGTRFSLLLPLV